MYIIHGMPECNILSYYQIFHSHSLTIATVFFPVYRSLLHHRTIYNGHRMLLHFELWPCKHVVPSVGERHWLLCTDWSFTNCACTPSLSETFFRILQTLCRHCPYSHVTYLGLNLLNNVISSCHKSGVNCANMLSHSQNHMHAVHCQSLSNQFRWQHIYIQMSAENVFTFAFSVA